MRSFTWHRRSLTLVALAFSTLLLATAPPLLADGPDTGIVEGRVTAGGGEGLPGVLVELSGERASQSVVTQTGGTFRFGGIVPDNYKLKATLEGFGSADGVAAVTAGGRARVDLRMGLSASEEITVTSEAALVDKFNVTAGATMRAETAGEISAAVRSFYGALQVLPGVTNDAESMDLSESRPTINGALWQESNVYIDGIDATFSLAGGGTRVVLPTSALSEVILEAGGGGAEYGRNVGSHTNLIVKSGGNRFHGEVAGVYSDNSWNENYDPQPILAQDERLVNTFIDKGQTLDQAIASAINFPVYAPGEQRGDSVNIEASIGGPLKRNKAWFFLARGETSTNQLDKTLDDQLFNNSLELVASIAKLNFQPGTKHSLALTYIDAPGDRIFLLPQMGDRYVATLFDVSGDINSLSWNWSVSQDLFLEAKIGRQVSDENRRRPFGPDIKFADPSYLATPSLGPYSPNNTDDAFTQSLDNTWHNGWIFGGGFGLNRFPREQINVALTNFSLAHHELKFGIDLQQVKWEQNVQRPNILAGFNFEPFTTYGYTNNCVGFANDPNFDNRDTRCFLVDFNGHGLEKGNSDSEGENSGIYLRDRFTAGDHWTFNLGLRGEQQTLTNDVGREVIDSFDLSPRLSVVYDIKGDGRQLFSLNVGRFFVQTPQALVNANLQETWNGASNASDLRMHIYGIRPDLGALGVPAEAICAGAAAGPAGFLFDLSRGPYCFKLGSVRPGEMYELVDQGLFESDINPYHRDEIVLGWEWQFADNWVVDAKLIHWEVGGLIGSTLQRDPDGGLFLLVANYRDYASIMRSLDFANNFLVTNANFTFNGAPATAAMAESILDNFQDDDRNYDALQLQLNRRYRGGWAWFNNLTLSKVEGKTYGGGNGSNDLGALNNLDDDYGRNLDVLLTDQLVATLRAQPDFCSSQGLTAGCIDDLTQFIGQPLSTINREGELPVNREIILKSYGYKVWTFGKHSINTGGLFVWQSGSPWQKTLSASNPNVSLADVARNTGINFYAVQRGTFNNPDFFWLNLSSAWTFPLGSKLNGRLRFEITNVTNEQEQVVSSDRTGLPLRSRRSFQEPRKYRLLASLRF